MSVGSEGASPKSSPMLIRPSSVQGLRVDILPLVCVEKEGVLWDVWECCLSASDF